MLFNNEENNKEVSGKDLRSIENDLLGEARQSEIEHSEKDKGANPTNNPGAENPGASQNVAASIPIPQEIPKAIMATINYALYEKRIQRLHTDYQEEARRVIKPTENQISIMGSLITWMTDRYAPALAHNPWLVPAAMAYEIGRIELAKYASFELVVKAANGGE